MHSSCVALAEPQGARPQPVPNETAANEAQGPLTRRDQEPQAALRRVRAPAPCTGPLEFVKSELAMSAPDILRRLLAWPSDRESEGEGAVEGPLNPTDATVMPSVA